MCVCVGVLVCLPSFLLALLLMARRFGVAAGNGNGPAYSFNFNIPFQHSVRFTVQHETDTLGGFYVVSELEGLRSSLCFHAIPLFIFSCPDDTWPPPLEKFTSTDCAGHEEQGDRYRWHHTPKDGSAAAAQGLP
jgi:hypothetical protein